MSATVRAVCVESPLRGKIELSVLYADFCMADCLRRGEAPFLGHLIYPRVLNDTNEVDRGHGIEAHLAWLRRSDAVVVYTDLGITTGMRMAIDLAQSIGIPVQFRELGHGWATRPRPIATPGFLGSN